MRKTILLCSKPQDSLPSSRATRTKAEHRLRKRAGRKWLYDIVKIKENTANATDLLKRETRRADYKAASQSDASNNSISNKSEKINQKTSEDIDSKYLELAKNPEQNREERQKMVDDAAKKEILTARCSLAADKNKKARF